MTFQIADNTISEHHPVFIIAEIGINHNGSVSLAKQLIKRAKDAGANAVKFQTYQAESLVTAEGDVADYQKEAGFTSQKEMLEHYQLTAAQFVEVKAYCDKVGLIFLSTPFDIESAQRLEQLGVPAYKVGSGDLTHYPLIKHLASYKKPLILSTGMATLEEIKAMVSILPTDTPFALLHCTSAYPAPYKDLHLLVLEKLKSTFNCIVGYSDHSLGCDVPFAATALGAKIIEKHLTLDRNLDGPDHAASLIPEEFTRMVKGIRRIETALGSGVKHVTPSEMNTKAAVRRGIYAAADLPVNHRLTEKDVMYLRPNKGIETSDYQAVLGSALKRSKAQGEPVYWEDLHRKDD
ncbi:N-acetylneuraminate synthase family protein [Thalassobacillus sp. CUG 92003]|uniref:N-acetylneuraminate synthase family protein n=1 Tax=Thalassobacillus sp. CUG 92003 TaxID=2736641 RepID=UPI0015E67EAE|nr:N-acetylneuraminate synthase family protein [Thalassobacillus sp. CUG 92003]